MQLLVRGLANHSIRLPPVWVGWVWTGAGLGNVPEAWSVCVALWTPCAALEDRAL